MPPDNHSFSHRPDSDAAISYASESIEGVHRYENANDLSKRLFEIGGNISEARSEYISRNFPNNEKRSLRGVVKKIFNSNYRFLGSEADLKQYESEIGASLFSGSINEDERVQFFNDNHKSWFFYRESHIGKPHRKSVTIHYEVHDNGVLRVSDLSGANGVFIGGQELHNFATATDMYEKLVFSKIYNDSQSTDILQ